MYFSIFVVVMRFTKNLKTFLLCLLSTQHIKNILENGAHFIKRLDQNKMEISLISRCILILTDRGRQAKEPGTI